MNHKNNAINLAIFVLYFIAGMEMLKQHDFIGLVEVLALFFIAIQDKEAKNETVQV